MARLIDADDILPKTFICDEVAEVRKFIEQAPTADAIEVSDEKLKTAIKLLIKQYEHSKASAFVNDPIAHALYHTWKQVDGRKDSNGKSIRI